MGAKWPCDRTKAWRRGTPIRIRLLRCCGFEVEDLMGLCPEPGAITWYPFVNLERSRTWPAKKSGRPANRPERARRPEYLKRRTERDAVREAAARFYGVRG